MRIPSAKDKERFVRLWIRLRFGVGVEEAWKRITEAYTERHRRYHNWEHILWCLSQFDLVRHKLSNPDAVEFAIYFHDIVYQPGAPDNEDRSVDVAMQHLAWASMEFKSLVRIFILDTMHTFVPATNDEKYMVDIDITSMGDPGQNARYQATVREEFLQFVSEEDYEHGRRAFITQFLKKERIYHTDFFHRLYELSARDNLAKELE